MALPTAEFLLAPVTAIAVPFVAGAGAYAVASGIRGVPNIAALGVAAAAGGASGMIKQVKARGVRLPGIAAASSLAGLGSFFLGRGPAMRAIGAGLVGVGAGLVV